jgi:hypothetical protein
VTNLRILIYTSWQIMQVKKFISSNIQFHHGSWLEACVPESMSPGLNSAKSVLFSWTRFPYSQTNPVTTLVPLYKTSVAQNVPDFMFVQSRYVHLILSRSRLWSWEEYSLSYRHLNRFLEHWKQRQKRRCMHISHQGGNTRHVRMCT